MSKVVVIGAGHGGLAAAARLKVRGHEVSVFEQSATFVTIPQILTLPAAYRDLFLKTGTDLEKDFELIEATYGHEFATSSGELIKIPASGVGRTLSELENSLGEKSALQWRNYLGEVGQLWQIVRAALIEDNSSNSTLKILGLANFARYRKFSNVVSRNLKDENLIRLAKAYRNQAYVDSESDLGLLALNAYVQQTFGVYDPTGGLSALTNQLEIRCATLGVQFSYNKTAQPVLLENELIGVELDSGQLISADFVVVNDLQSPPSSVTWRALPTVKTSTDRLFRVTERSWLGLGPAHAVLSANIVAGLIGSAE